MNNNSRSGGALMLASCLAVLLILAAAVARILPAGSETPTPKPDTIALATVTDPTNVPVLKTVTSWKQLHAAAANQPGYWDCFTRVTGFTKVQADDALAKEILGWNLQTTFLSKISLAAADADLAKRNQTRDPDVTSVDGFTNTRTKGCKTFNDGRSQARIALTMPGPNKDTPGTPAVLTHCGNPIGFSAAPPPPVHRPPPPRRPPHRPTPTTTPVTTPRTTPTTVPTSTSTTVPGTVKQPELSSNNPANSTSQVPADQRRCGTSGCGGQTTQPPDSPASHDNPGPTGCGVGATCAPPPTTTGTTLPPASYTPPPTAAPPTTPITPPPG